MCTVLVMNLTDFTKRSHPSELVQVDVKFSPQVFQTICHVWIGWSGNNILAQINWITLRVILLLGRRLYSSPLAKIYIHLQFVQHANTVHNFNQSFNWTENIGDVVSTSVSILPDWLENGLQRKNWDLVSQFHRLVLLLWTVFVFPDFTAEFSNVVRTGDPECCQELGLLMWWEIWVFDGFLWYQPWFIQLSYVSVFLLILFIKQRVFNMSKGSHHRSEALLEGIQYTQIDSNLE